MMNVFLGKFETTTDVAFLFLFLCGWNETRLLECKQLTFTSMLELFEISVKAVLGNSRHTDDVLFLLSDVLCWHFGYYFKDVCTVCVCVRV